MEPSRLLVNALSLSQGGGRTYVRNILRELRADPRGFEVTVLAAAGQLDPQEAEGFEVLDVELPRSRGLVRTLARVGYEQSLLPWRGRRFDLVYCVADLAPAWSPSPTVVALRNLNIYDRRFYDGPRTRTLFRLVRLGLKRARRVVCPSRSAADYIAETVGIPRDRITVIHHGISTEAFRDVAPMDGEQGYLFLPAHLERHKNFEVLFECLQHVSDPGLEVWIAGGEDLDPAWGAELRSRVKAMDLESRVRFLGAVPYGDVLRYYRGAKALVFPSLLESFGHPMLEAMVAGTPVIASDIPSFHEIGEDIALFFDPKDPVALARTVDRLDEEPAQTRERVERGLERAAEFTWSRSVDRLCEVFREALSPGERVGGVAEPRDA